MVRNLLAITRIDAGALELRPDWIDLREIVERVVSAARRRGAARSIEVELPRDLPLVRADATLVEQAIGNVVGNAIAHTPAGHTTCIDAQVVRRISVTLRVTDDGPGIRGRHAAAHLRQVRQGAGRVRDRRRRQGTGLGLAIAKGIMEAHGGIDRVPKARCAAGAARASR